MNINTNIVDHPEFKWMPGMLASDNADQPRRIIRVDESLAGLSPLVQTCTTGGSPDLRALQDRGLVAVDLDDPATVGCLTHSSGMDWSESKIRRIALGTCYK